VVVISQPQLLELTRYIVLNPVRAGLVKHPRLWRWSSYRATMGDRTRPPFLTTEWVLALFGPDVARSRAEYERFVSEGMTRNRPLSRALVPGTKRALRTGQPKP
jgi:hypothetical protein